MSKGAIRLMRGCGGHFLCPYPARMRGGDRDHGAAVLSGCRNGRLGGPAVVTTEIRVTGRSARAIRHHTPVWDGDPPEKEIIGERTLGIACRM